MDLKSQNYDLKVEIDRSKLLKNHDNVKSNNYDKKSELWQKNEIVTEITVQNVLNYITSLFIEWHTKSYCNYEIKKI